MWMNKLLKARFNQLFTQRKEAKKLPLSLYLHLTTPRHIVLFSRIFSYSKMLLMEAPLLLLTQLQLTTLFFGSYSMFCCLSLPSTWPMQVFVCTQFLIDATYSVSKLSTFAHDFEAPNTLHLHPMIQALSFYIQWHSSLWLLFPSWLPYLPKSIVCSVLLGVDTPLMVFSRQTSPFDWDSRPILCGFGTQVSTPFFPLQCSY